MAELTEEMSRMSNSVRDMEGKYLTFSLSSEVYGISILKVKEIIGMMWITSIPQTPRFVKGVINLRGRVIPVMDMRIRLGMEEAEYTKHTCIIVVDIITEFGQVMIGVVVDSVNEVLNIKAKDIELTPSFGVSVNMEDILGVGKINNEMKILLNIDVLISGQEWV